MIETDVIDSLDACEPISNQDSESYSPKKKHHHHKHKSKHKKKHKKRKKKKQKRELEEEANGSTVEADKSDKKGRRESRISASPVSPSEHQKSIVTPETNCESRSHKKKKKKKTKSHHHKKHVPSPVKDNKSPSPYPQKRPRHQRHSSPSPLKHQRHRPRNYRPSISPLSHKRSRSRGRNERVSPCRTSRRSRSPLHRSRRDISPEVMYKRGRPPLPSRQRSYTPSHSPTPRSISPQRKRNHLNIDKEELRKQALSTLCTWAKTQQQPGRMTYCAGLPSTAWEETLTAAQQLLQSLHSNVRLPDVSSVPGASSESSLQAAIQQCSLISQGVLDVTQPVSKPWKPVAAVNPMIVKNLNQLALTNGTGSQIPASNVVESFPVSTGDYHRIKEEQLKENDGISHEESQTSAVIPWTPLDSLRAPRPTQKQLTTAPAIQENSIGYRLLQKMGWSQGQSLGASGEGVLEPVIGQVKFDRGGLAASDEKAPQKMDRPARILIDKFLPVKSVNDYCQAYGLGRPQFTEQGHGKCQALPPFQVTAVLGGVTYVSDMCQSKKLAKADVCFKVLQALGLVDPAETCPGIVPT